MLNMGEMDITVYLMKYDIYKNLYEEYENEKSYSNKLILLRDINYLKE